MKIGNAKIRRKPSASFGCTGWCKPCGLRLKTDKAFLIAHNDVIEQRDVEQLASSLDTLGQFRVRSAGCRISAGMIMPGNDGTDGKLTCGFIMIRKDEEMVVVITPYRVAWSVVGALGLILTIGEIVSAKFPRSPELIYIVGPGLLMSALYCLTRQHRSSSSHD